MPIRNRFNDALRVLLSVFLLSTAFAQNGFPNKPITVIVGTPPGASDQMVRSISDSLQAQLGQPLVVINKVGANGVLAVNSVINSSPDGYTLMFGSMSTMTMNPFVYSSAKYSATDNLIPVAQYATYPMMWVASKKSGIRSLNEMINFAKQKQQDFFVGHIGEGGMAALVERSLFDKYGLKPTYVTYPGNAQTVMAMQANDIQISVEPFILAVSQSKGGLFTPLGVTSSERNKAMPDLPSATELGMMDFGMDAWFGFFAPKNTPTSIINKLNLAINNALSESKTRAAIEEAGGVIKQLDARGFSKIVSDDIQRFSTMIPASGVVPK